MKCIVVFGYQTIHQRRRNTPPSITDELIIHQPHSILEAPIQGILPHFFVALTIWVVFSPIYLKNIASILPMYRSCLLVGLPRFSYLDDSLQSPKLSLLLRPPPHWRRSQRGWITSGRPLSPRRHFRPSNSGRHNRPKYKGAREKFLLHGRHHVPHIPGRLGHPMYGHITERRVSRVSPTGHEITHGVHWPRSVNHMEVEFREQLMPTCFAWRGTPHGFEVLRSPIFKATVVRTDLHALVPHPTMPF